MPDRLLLVTADDFGIGPETTRGILDLAAGGVVTSTVLLVNSPFAENAVRQWEVAGQPLELGWHPCLTLDAPILPPGRVPSLVGSDGRFWSRGDFLKRLWLGFICISEVEAEFQAQFDRFVELVGGPPANVNAHHHVHVFSAVQEALNRVLGRVTPVPFLRRVVESPGTLLRVPGGRLKRVVLTALSRWSARVFPGNDALLGVTDPRCVRDPEFFTHWLRATRAHAVELCCHPGHPDVALVGRDPDPYRRRPRELELLQAPAFLDAVRAAGFRLVCATEMATMARPARTPASASSVGNRDTDRRAERSHRTHPIPPRWSARP